MRVVLAFTAVTIAGKHATRAVLGSSKKAPKTVANWVSGPGYDAYMGYLVQLEMSSDGGLNAAGDKAAKLLNSESGASKAFAEHEAHRTGEAAFKKFIEASVGVYHVPAMVGTHPWLTPSQIHATHSGSHWITVVAYDADNYYYIDTCRGGKGISKCGSPPNVPGGGYADPPFYKKDASGHSYAYRLDPRYRDTWQISKHALFKASDTLNGSREFYIVDVALAARFVLGR